MANRARRVFFLQAALGLIGSATVVLSLAVSLGAVSFSVPSVAALLEACRSFVLPDVSIGSVVVLALGVLSFSVLLLAMRSTVRQIRGSRKFISALPVVGPRQVGSTQVELFIDTRPQAFCAGLLRPRIYLSTGTEKSLSDAELRAVVAHESHHARYRDPLRILLARVLSEALFFLPALRKLGAGYSALTELAADETAVRRSGDRRHLASALLQFDQHANPAVAGIAPERVDNLIGERPHFELPLALLAGALVIVSAITVIALRIAQATDAVSLNLPLFAAQLCMLMMALLPPVIGAVTLLWARRRLFREKLAHE